MELKDMISSAILTAIVLFGILSFAYYFAIDNDTSTSLFDDPEINQSFKSLQGNLTDSYSSGKSSKEGYESENPTLSTDSFIFSSIISTGKTFTSTMTNIFNITLGLIFSKLGLSPILIGGIVAILMVLIIFLAWRVVKQG